MFQCTCYVYISIILFEFFFLYIFSICSYYSAKHLKEFVFGYFY